MPIRLELVEKALARVESILQEEEKIFVGDLQMVVRPLRGEDEIALLEYASLAFQEGSRPAKVATMDFLFRIHVMTIAAAVVQIGDQDLRSAEIETGVILPSGLPQLRDRIDVIRDVILQHWTKPLITRVFVAVTETVARLSSKAADRVRFEPMDLEAEIKRSEERLDELKKAREDKSAATKGWSQKTFEDALAYAKGGSLPDVNIEGLVPEQEITPPALAPQEETQQQEPPQPPRRQKAFTGVQASPISRPPSPPQEEKPSELESMEERILPDNTFLDDANPEASVEAEIVRHQRLAQQFAAKSRATDPRVQGLREAANLHNAVLNTKEVPYQNEAPHPQRWGQQVPEDSVWSGQSQELRKTPKPDLSKVQLNPDLNNPRFKGR